METPVKSPQPQQDQINGKHNGHTEVVVNKDDMEVEVIAINGSPNGELKKMQINDTPKSDTSLTSPSSAQPTPKRRKLDKAEKEAERLKREEEKRLREQERLEKARIKEEEKRRKEEERLRREEEKKRKDEEKEQERLKREEEKRQREEERKRKEEEKEQERLKKEEEKKQKEDERKRKEEEREQERLKKEQEKRKREEERRRKEEERLKLEAEKKLAQEKAEEQKQKQANLLRKFLQITPNRTSTTPGNGESNVTPTTGSSASASGTPENFAAGGTSASAKSTKTPAEVIDLENETASTHKSTKGKNLLFRFNCSFQNEKPPDLSFNPMPFQVKINMALAPVLRRVWGDEDKTRLDQAMTALSYNTEEEAKMDSSDNQNMHSEVEIEMTEGEKKNVNSLSSKQSYLNEIKNRPTRKSGKTLVKRSTLVTNQDEDVEVLFDKSVNTVPIIEPPLPDYHFKLLQFTENRRPAYWGTWKTKSKKVSPRRPFAQEDEIDYDFDSDDEWEDEPEDAEELKSEKESDDDDDEVGGTLEDDEDDDDEDEEGWMVPHGYLSDDELADVKVEGGKTETKTATLEEVEDEENMQTKIRVKDSLKKQEEMYYKEIKLTKRVGLPVLLTDNFDSAYRFLIFTKKKERHIAMRRAANSFYEKLQEAKEGRLTTTSLYEGFSSSDDDDGEWKESEDDENDSDASDSENDVSDEESKLIEKEHGIEIKIEKPQKPEKLEENRKPSVLTTEVAEVEVMDTS